MSGRRRGRYPDPPCRRRAAAAAEQRDVARSRSGGGKTVSRVDLTERDLKELRERGSSFEEIERQVALLSGPPRPVRIDRPCTTGDGIAVLDETTIERALERHRTAADEGRCLQLVPASGAASRMFKELQAVRVRPVAASRETLLEERHAGSAEAETVLRFLDGIERFAFFDTLERTVARREGADLRALTRSGPVRPILDALLDPEAMGYGALPKGLLEFHSYPDGTRTAFEEHLVEATRLVRDRGGTCRLHFTVSEDHLSRFRLLLEERRDRYEAVYSSGYDVAFSLQKPWTDTVALDDRGALVRREDGGLFFRPGGHGALLANLQETEGDLILAKNIDNVVPDARKEVSYRWGKVLLGLLAIVQDETHALLDRLRDGDHAAVEPARELLRGRFHRSADGDVEALVALLDRPIRICGMVPNTGEPGGGPYWVRGGEEDLSLQIVEKAQIDSESEDQVERFRRSTHFNPVFMALGIRGADGDPFALKRFVDPETTIITRKAVGGTEVRVLEWPGLWNGAMAHWNTLFVEVPLDVFHPVKTVLDLLRPDHQPG
ncbi:MAG: DUF4301 family protein [Candidatus Eisenbacteria bacterium]|nr:DUF4301 family protein [Candidatus Latescibacterota bacterium]MBD3301977.1 DUF4301 family protein [Candidatus Eisenbacteria bacterium]